MMTVFSCKNQIRFNRERALQNLVNFGRIWLRTCIFRGEPCILVAQNAKRLLSLADTSLRLRKLAAAGCWCRCAATLQMHSLSVRLNANESVKSGKWSRVKFTLSRHSQVRIVMILFILWLFEKYICLWKHFWNYCRRIGYVASLKVWNSLLHCCFSV